MRAKESALSRQPEADDDEGVWERLRAGAAQPGHRDRAYSDVVPRASYAGGQDPYSSYAEYVQQGDDEEEDEAVWERLRSQQQLTEQRYSEVAPIGTHSAWETEQVDHAWQQQQEAEYYAQQQAYQQQQEAEYYAQQQAYQQQQEAAYYAQQQAYQQQQEAAYYAQQQHAQQQQQFAQQQAYQQQFAQQQAYAAPTRDDDYGTKRSGKGGAVVMILATLALLGGGGFVAHRAGMFRKSPTPIYIPPTSDTPSAATVAAAAPVGVEEARARDQLFGTHTAPAAPSAPVEAKAATPEPTPTVVETKQVETKHAAPTRHAKAKRVKAKKAARHASAKRSAPAKAKSDKSGLSGVANRSNDPLDGI